MKDALTKHFATMTSIAAKAPKGEKRTFIYADVQPPDFNAHSGGQWEPQIIATLGLTSVLPPKPGSRNLTLSLEQVFSHNPDVMFLGVDDQTNVIDQWKSSPVYKQISAVKNKAVYEVDDTLWSSERGIRTSEIVLQQAIDKLAGTGQ
jgi:ferric citrate transport system substrate-binding protein